MKGGRLQGGFAWDAIAGLAFGLLSTGAMAQVGSAVVTLELTPGSRQAAMGEAGASLPDFQSWYHNPSLSPLSFPDGAVSVAGAFFYQELLPPLGIEDLDHRVFGLPSVFVPGWGYAGLHHAKTRFGNELVGTGGTRSSGTETVTTLTLAGDGLRLFRDGFRRRFWDVLPGVNVKYIDSRYGSDRARTFAFDAGLTGLLSHTFKEGGLLRTEASLLVGGVVRNMGPGVFYIDRENADPLPLTAVGSFTAELAAGDLSFVQKLGRWGNPQGLPSRPLPAFRLLFTRDHLVHLHEGDGDGHPTFFLTSMGRFFSDPWGEAYRNRRENYFGWEVAFANLVSVRRGRLKDPWGARDEHHSGFGCSLPFPILGFRFSYDESLIEDRYSGIRGGQKSRTFNLVYQHTLR